jgi:AcrR family transcriptional regulator
MRDADTMAETVSREDIVLRLFELFRCAGYEGVSIGDISEATGLGRSSLYHHFPGGKEEMAAAVVDFASGWVGANIVAALKDEGSLARRLDKMFAAVRALYDGGKLPCLVASLLVSRSDAEAGTRAGAIIGDWIEELAAALREEGLKRAEAETRATEAIIAIEGALIVARATGRLSVFESALKRARADLTMGLKRG